LAVVVAEREAERRNSLETEGGMLAVCRIAASEDNLVVWDMHIAVVGSLGADTLAAAEVAEMDLTTEEEVVVDILVLGIPVPVVDMDSMAGFRPVVVVGMARVVEEAGIGLEEDIHMAVADRRRSIVVSWVLLAGKKV